MRLRMSGGVVSDSSDDMEFYSGFCDDEIDDEEHADFEIKRKLVIEYCYPHLEQMWAARIVGILLGCSFKDSKEHADVYLENAGV